MPIYVGPTTRNSFAIDRQSVTFGSDEVVRYTFGGDESWRREER